MGIYTDWSEKWARYSSDKIAIKQYESQEQYSYQEIYHLSNHLAYRLTEEYGIKKGDRIIILAENKIAYMILFAMAQKTGTVLVPLNYRMTPSEIKQQLKIIKPSLLITSNQFRGKLEDASEGKVSLVDISMVDEGNRNMSNRFPGVDITADDPLMILFTSGSSGYPKGAIYSHQMCTWNSITTSLSLIINTESRTLNCMPLFHTGGWNVLMLPIFHHGGYTCLMESFDADQILRLIEKERPTIFMGVPTMLKMMTQSELFSTVDLSSLLYIIVGGEAMDTGEINLWHERGVYIRQGYGMTEVGPNLTSLHQDDAIRKIGSIGKPNFYVETKIIDSEGNIVEGEGHGQLLLKGPMVTPGYWENQEETDKTIVDGWLHTGDLIKRDDEGFLFVVDRIKNMFISGGENVYPLEVERVLKSHPEVMEAVVVPVKDEKWGEVGKAFLQCYEKEDIDLSNLKIFLKEKLASFKVPKHFEVLEEIPKNDANKIDRKSLKAY